MNWSDLSFFNDGQFDEVSRFLTEKYNQGITVHPEPEEMLYALELTPLDAVRVVILGQDPYPTPGNAHGLAFSVPEGVSTPASLRNVNKEIQDEFKQCPGLANGNLEHWARQGVLLLNTSLTVESGDPGSHSGLWTGLTNEVMQVVNRERDRVVFMLWGKHAHQKAIYVDAKKHLVLKAAHPSPLAARSGFFGCNHFRLCNEDLASRNEPVICWCGNQGDCTWED